MRHRVMTQAGLLIVLAGSTACARFARLPSPYLSGRVAPGDLPARLDQALTGFANQGFSGTALVAVGPRVLLYRGYGEANRARELPNNAETRYPLGLLSRQFTAATVLTLAAEGTLATTDLASTWLGPAAPDLTLEQLLTGSAEAGPTVRPTSSGGARAARRLSPDLDAGAVLDSVITRAGRDSLYKVLRDRVLLPNGLTRTFLEDGRRDDSLVARGYTADAGSTVMARGLVAPLADLWRWHVALTSGKVLPAGQWERLLRPAPEGYGVGMVVGRTPSGERIVEHVSDDLGFQLWYAWLPDRDCLILLAVNNDQGWRQSIAERLMELVTRGAGGGLAIVPQ
jgi:CubicO group peptidase (beta-lactamase class C family)